MAQKVMTLLVDDLTGDEIPDGKGETVTFALDGTTYEIDLTNKNADALRGVIYDYSAKGRKVGRKTGTAGKKSQVGASAAEVRAWAAANGHDVPERGRIPGAVREAFEAR